MIALAAVTAAWQFAQHQAEPGELDKTARLYEQQAIAICAQDPRLRGWFLQYATFSAATLTQTVWTHHDSTTTCAVQLNKITSFLQEEGR